MVWLIENTPPSKDVSQPMKKTHGISSWKKFRENKREHMPKMNSTNLIDLYVLYVKHYII